MPEPEMAQHQIHKRGGQKVMEDDVIIKSQVKWKQIMDQGQGIEKTDLKGGQQRITAEYVGIPEREMAGSDLLHHQMPEGIEIAAQILESYDLVSGEEAEEKKRDQYQKNTKGAESLFVDFHP
jgi:hypothetical protein